MKLKNFKLACLLVFISGCTDSKVKESSVLQASSISTLKEYKNKALQVYTTAKDTELRLTKTSDQIFKDKVQPLETEVAIFINPNKTFQKYLGIGGAITDASSEVFATLDNDQQNKLLQSLFGKEGIGYNIIRTSIHSSDFGLGSHTYIEEGDTDLKTFTIEKDKKKRIPFIKRAIELIKDDLVFYASPWSPPAFMKSNKNMLYGGKLLPEFRQSWADYYVKFIKAYEKEGIPVWGLTIQNEPMAIQRWESCIYTADEERDFLKNYLGPTLENAGLGDKKIIVWDHNRDLISDRANTIFEDSEASKYAWGIGLHWYETWTGGLPKYDNLKNINESFPSKNMLFTEGCAEGFDSEKLHFWPNAERYGNSIINDFNSGVVGWTDWNILLDERGGPNHVENFCFAPIHANTKTGELIFTPTYYYIGHFSKFIKPGAVRVSTTTSRTTIESTSFKNKDGKIITVVMNKTDSKVTYKLIVGNSESLLEIEPRAMQTIIY
ncbi:MAG: glycoside hydrolase family 30 protein [Flavobacterium sp.]|jgi:glucosylceramidase|nr:glycoside hydrolase family 30 protein [Flavobacterium sp.]